MPKGITIDVFMGVCCARVGASLGCPMAGSPSTRVARYLRAHQAGRDVAGGKSPASYGEPPEQYEQVLAMASVASLPVARNAREAVANLGQLDRPPRLATTLPASQPASAASSQPAGAAASGPAASKPATSRPVASAAAASSPVRYNGLPDGPPEPLARRRFGLGPPLLDYLHPN